VLPLTAGAHPPPPPAAARSPLPGTKDPLDVPVSSGSRYMTKMVSPRRARIGAARRSVLGQLGRPHLRSGPAPVGPNPHLRALDRSCRPQLSCVHRQKVWHRGRNPPTRSPVHDSRIRKNPPPKLPAVGELGG